MMQSRRHIIVDSSVGPLTFVEEDDSLVGLYFDNCTHPPGEEKLGLRFNEQGVSGTLLDTAHRQVVEYLSAERQIFDLPFHFEGTNFQKSVWELLTQIPYGSTVTYGDLAVKVGGIGYSQQVGQTVGRNPLSIIVPCHRVVGANGSLTGFGGGLDRKRVLLELERPAA